MRPPARPRRLPLFAFATIFLVLETSAGLCVKRALPALQVHRYLLELRTGEDDSARQAAAHIRGMGRSVIPLLVSSLDDSNPVFRKRVLQLLGDFRDASVRPTLQTYLQNEDDYVRRECVLALAKLDTRQVFPDLLEALHDRAPEVRMEAARTLGALTPDPLLGQLLATLYRSAPDVRLELQEAVHRRYPLGAVAPYLAASMQGDEPEERRDALLLLHDYLREGASATNMAARALAPPLEEAAQARDPEVAREALWSLGRIDQSRAAQLALVSSQDPALADETRTLCLAILGELRPSGTLDAVIACLRCARPAVEAQARDTLRALARAEDAPRISACLSGGDFPDEAQDTFLAVLSETGGAEAVPALLPLAQDAAGPHVEAAQRALLAIGARQGPACVPRLIDALAGQSDSAFGLVSHLLTDATAYDPSLGDPRALSDAVSVRRIRETTAWKSWLRDHAQETPAEWKESGEREASSYLASPNAIVRQRSLQHLEHIRSACATRSALELLCDPDEYVWGTAADILARDASEEVKAALVSRLQTDAEGAARAARLIARMPGPAFVPPLMAALDRPETEVRERVIEALASMGDARAVPRLMDLLFDRDEGLRASASFAMSQFNDKSVSPRLVQGLKDPRADVRKYCATLLGRMGDASVVPDLLPLTGDDTASVRACASGAIEELTGQRFNFSEQTPAQIMHEAWVDWWSRNDPGR